MADYRELSQAYAQGAIKGSVLVNGSAAIALLTQLAALPARLSGAALYSMCFWAVGVALGVFCWVLAFASTRYVDKSEREEGLEQAHLNTSDNFMTWGLALFAISIAAFLAGVFILAYGYANAQ